MTHLLSTKLHRLVPKNDTAPRNDISYIQAFAMYLKDDRFHKSLKCTNIMTLLEMMCIMKVSQSVT